MQNEKTVFQASCRSFIEALHANRRGEITEAELNAVGKKSAKAEQAMYAAGFQIGNTAPTRLV